jgi:hypothetical protein
MRNVTPNTAERIMYGTPRLVSRAIYPPATEPLSIAAPPTIEPLANTDSSAPPPEIRHHTSGNFEQHLPQCKKGVGGESLGIVEPGIEQKQGIDAPEEGSAGGRLPFDARSL